MVAQLNGDFRCSHFVVVLLDGIILIVFCRLFLKGTLQIQIEQNRCAMACQGCGAVSY